MKFLVVLVVIAVAFGVWNHNRKQALRARQAAKAPPPPLVPQTMVRCAHCGVHLARQDAVSQDDQWYCCAEHARAGVRTPAGVGHDAG